MATAAIILAAGQGTRMQSDMPKVLHELAGAPLFAHALNSAQSMNPAKIVLVVGPGGAEVGKAAHAMDPEIVIVEQSEQLGTGHAVAQARKALAGFDGDVVVLYGDTPFISAETLSKMSNERRAGHGFIILGFQSADPARYGRLIMSGNRLERIVEFKDATDEERRVTFCNSGVMMADSETMFDLIAQIGNDNASGEYYLTDIVELANQKGHSATAVTCPEAETMGINSRADLAKAEAVFQNHARNAALDNGVTLIAPETVYFSHDTHIGRDVVVEPNVVFGPGVTVETSARIRAFSHLEGAHVGGGAVVGPYARLRPGTEMGNDSKVGNFVEIKNAIIGEGAKVNHLSYIGDASVGQGANIGAGTVTCNYNGVEKFRTEIGDRAFVGSNTMLVAPVTIGAEAITASGSVITKDVPAGALALGRAEQITKPGVGRKLFDMYKLAKAKRKKGQ